MDSWSLTTSQKSLGIGYGISVLLFLLYFLWEDGPFHYSRRVESFYITFALALAYLAPLSAQFLVSEMPAQDEAMLALRGLMRFVLLFQILHQMVLPQAHPRFLEAAGGAVRRAQMTPGGKVKRLARELDTRISAAMHRSSATAAGLIGNHLSGPLLWLLLMAHEMVWQLGFLTRIHDFLIWFELGLVLVLVVSELSRIRAVGWDQALIHGMVEGLVGGAGSDLGFVLASISVGSLFEVAGRDTVRLLTDEALEKDLLSSTSKAIIVHALQQRGLRHSASSQRAVVRLILSCRGIELTTLKNILDSSGSYKNLHKLVYEEVTVKKKRTILEHLRHEANQVRLSRAGHSAVGIKLLSDVDDTLYSSGGRFPAGCDTRFPKHMVYPGCLRLFQAICQANVSECEAERIDGPSCDLVFLSARPHVYKDLMEDYSYRLFRDLVEDGRMHAFPTLLPGRLKSSFGAMLKTPCLGSWAWKHVAEIKYNTFLSFQELYLEYDFVFCGDNGQGDLLAAQLMCQGQGAAGASSPPDSGSTFGRLLKSLSMQSAAPPRSGLCFALIHEVKPEAQVMARECQKERGNLWRSSLAASGIVLHSSYIGAAVALHHRYENIMPLEVLAEVAKAAVEELAAAQDAQHDWDWAGGALEAILEDLKDANALMQAAGLPLLETRALASPTQLARRRTQRKTTLLRMREYTSTEKASEEPSSQTDVDLEAGTVSSAGIATGIPASSCLLGRSGILPSAEKPGTKVQI